MLRLLTILLLLSLYGAGQIASPYALPQGAKGKAWLLQSRYSMFPDSLRDVQARVYNDKTYSAAEHYSDSSVLLFVPDYFDAGRPHEFVVWIHGWNNNIDSALKTFRLLEQFYGSGRNAVFIFPQGPKNAPDSYAGKFEKPDGFARLWAEVADFLAKKQHVYRDGAHPATAGMVLAGHSGAYRAIGKILALEPHWMEAATVLLFDGLYGETDSYIEFIKAPKSRFLHIYTDHGGTKDNSLDMMKTLSSMNIAFAHTEEDLITKEVLKQHRVTFIHSKKTCLKPLKPLNKQYVPIHTIQKYVTISIWH